MAYGRNVASCDPLITDNIIHSVRDAPLDFQGGRKFSEKKFPPGTQVKKKNSPSSSKKKNSPLTLQKIGKKIPPSSKEKEKMHREAFKWSLKGRNPRASGGAAPGPPCPICIQQVCFYMHFQ